MYIFLCVLFVPGLYFNSPIVALRVQALEIHCFSLCICCWSGGIGATYLHSAPQTGYMTAAVAPHPTYFGTYSIFIKYGH